MAPAAVEVRLGMLTMPAVAVWANMGAWGGVLKTRISERAPTED